MVSGSGGSSSGRVAVAAVVEVAAVVVTSGDSTVMLCQFLSFLCGSWAGGVGFELSTSEFQSSYFGACWLEA